MKLPILIISFNNHEFAANTIAQLERFGQDQIIVIDNASTRSETRAWLASLKHKVIFNPRNYGHTCWLRPEIFDAMPDRFCVTDPDLQFNPNLPANFMDLLYEWSVRFDALKVGFALDLSDSQRMFQDEDYHEGKSIRAWEEQFWRHRIYGESHEMYLADVDTTFHLYSKRGNLRRNFRVAGQFTAKHLPWYTDNPVVSAEAMTQMYEAADTKVSTMARLHLRHQEKLRDINASVHLYQIAYSEESRASIEPGYSVLDNISNQRPDWYEYWPIRNALMNNALDERAYYGFFSPKFGNKTFMSCEQVRNVVRAAAPNADVVLFSPQPDMGAFFLNVFEQAEAFDAGFLDAMEAFLRYAGRPADIRGMIMDSTTTVFSNYFVARPAFWREWLRLGESLWSVCEGPDSELKAQCTAATTYKGAQRKVFMQERLASYLLATQPRWRSHAANPFGFGWSATRLREHPEDAIMCDALKSSYLRAGYPQYLEAFGAIRRRFVSSGNQVSTDQSR